VDKDCKTRKEAPLVDAQKYGHRQGECKSSTREESWYEESEDPNHQWNVAF
jgi:hypothetical protein